LLRYAAGVALLVVCLAVDGRGPQSSKHSAAIVHAYGSQAAVDRAQEILRLLQDGKDAEVIQECERAADEARQQNRPRAALFYLNALAGARFKLGEYEKAQQAYIQLRDLGLQTGMVKWALAALSNLSSLYMHAFDTDSALAAAEEAHSLLPAMTRAERPQVILQLARVLLHRRDPQRAVPLFQEAIRIAEELGNHRTQAEAWDQLGLEMLQNERLDEAGDALRRALTLRRTHSDRSLFATEQKLAQLELRLGNTPAARAYIDAAFSRPARNPVQVPPHLMYLTRAQVAAAEGRLRTALADYRLAATEAEEWRGRSLFADAFRIGADGWLHQIYEGAVEAAVGLYQQSGSAAFAELAWEFAERARTASLREGLAASQDWTGHLPASYWEKLDRLRELEAEHFSGVRRTPVAGDESTRLRMQLAEIESAAFASSVSRPRQSSSTSKTFLKTGEKNPNPISLKVFRNTLRDKQLFISFLLGDKASYRWVVHRKGFEFKVLSGREQIVNELESLRSAIRNSDNSFQDLSRKVYGRLFSGLRTDGETHWHIAVDDQLFELPVAALIPPSQRGGAAFLVERQSFNLVPGAWAIGGEEAPLPQRFLGLADGVYNTADPRYSGSQGRGWLRLVPALAAGGSAPLELPRLLASRIEVENAARQFDAEAVLLTGPQFNRKELLEALSSEPQYIHVAAHFLVDREGAGRAAVVMGVAPDSLGRPRLELLTAKDVASLKVPGSVVVLSGCSSGAGRIVPAAGVLGLARSWLAAGARAVIATQWPTTDDSGELFSRFYKYLADDAVKRVTPAEALRRAQMDMLRSGTFRADPKHWASYGLIGRSN
jgi:CHAT domain-containing protein/tetratricopeptide (TPR) repeat protein